ncbi:unnamed protein product [Spirodela intermedia]|uniref:NADH dehydrogenase subunit 1 n=1 Tax=Spirodela intermedia TaxID=51605 RepID=A0ABN7E9Y3_SPIIN|nr:unnamed protein product [Spirodela intermedia]
MVGYSDSTFVENLIDRQNIDGLCLILGGCLIFMDI